MSASFKVWILTIRGTGSLFPLEFFISKVLPVSCFSEMRSVGLMKVGQYIQWGYITTFSRQLISLAQPNRYQLLNPVSSIPISSLKELGLAWIQCRNGRIHAIKNSSYILRCHKQTRIPDDIVRCHPSNFFQFCPSKHLKWIWIILTTMNFAKMLQWSALKSSDWLLPNVT